LPSRAEPDLSAILQFCAAGKAGQAHQRWAGRTCGHKDDKSERQTVPRFAGAPAPDFLSGGKKIKLKFNFPAAETQKLRELAGLNSAKLRTSKIWRSFQDKVRTYFALHPEVTL